MATTTDDTSVDIEDAATALDSADSADTTNARIPTAAEASAVTMTGAPTAEDFSATQEGIKTSTAATNDFMEEEDSAAKETLMVAEVPTKAGESCVSEGTTEAEASLTFENSAVTKGCMEIVAVTSDVVPAVDSVTLKVVSANYSSTIKECAMVKESAAVEDCAKVEDIVAVEVAAADAAERSAERQTSAMAGNVGVAKDPLATGNLTDGDFPKIAVLVPNPHANEDAVVSESSQADEFSSSVDLESVANSASVNHRTEAKDFVLTVDLAPADNFAADQNSAVGGCMMAGENSAIDDSAKVDDPSSAGDFVVAFDCEATMDFPAADGTAGELPDETCLQKDSAETLRLLCSTSASSEDLTTGLQEPEEVFDEDDEDAVSEVWPGDVCGVADFEEVMQVASAAHEVQVAWEVVCSRIVVRSEPSLKSAAIGHRLHGEVLFEEAAWENPDWVKLSQESGYLLKDGSQNDPALGLLLRPYDVPHAPASARGIVLRILKTAWSDAKLHATDQLDPRLIENLRAACLEAASSAFQDGTRGLTESCDIFREVLRSAIRTSCGFSVLHGDEEPAFDTVPIILERMECRQLPKLETASQIIVAATAIFENQPTLVDLSVPEGTTLHVVGDLHGQFTDLWHIFKKFGEPSATNWFLFNGDFVDRGGFSVEVCLSLFAMKIAQPDHVHLNRGNHETVGMNALYGFMREVEQKYSSPIFHLFSAAFRSLPLATCVNGSVLVIHGGLGRNDGLTLDAIRAVERQREPEEGRDPLMIDILWSDPMDHRSGRMPSPRGAGTLFGADVTERFCEENGLSFVIRSHELKMNGYEWHHNQRCLTVFSASNYCGSCRNDGAVCDITPRVGTPTVTLSEVAVRRFSTLSDS
eukprot:TRINITY_DN54817_c0_g1_i1.p1 TRINITY_DN54817_c0_g1~~TRINITY_DN54817_c0_g1_i1.p1  ORF type:complete len:978 (-),score=172.46 TRINITY_DN54817_c0_g1_i1:95-2710(-)